MMCVRTRSISRYFGIYFGIPSERVLELFENEKGCALTDDETIACMVEGAGCGLRGGVGGCGQGAGTLEADEGEGVDAGFGAAG